MNACSPWRGHAGPKTQVPAGAPRPVIVSADYLFLRLVLRTAPVLLLPGFHVLQAGY